MSKKTNFTRTPEQEEQDRLKRLERAQMRGVSSCSTSETHQHPQQEHDFLDGFDQSIGIFGDSSVANGESGKIFDYGHGLLQLHLANVGGCAVKLMSHYVWNAALVMAEYIEAAQVIDVRGQRVAEFGAGAALPGLLCVKRGAAFVTLTDYPDPMIVQNIERNWYENLVESVQDKEARQKQHLESIQTTAYQDLFASSSSQQNKEKRHAIEQRVKCAVRGHAWGESVQEILDCLPSSSMSNSASNIATGNELQAKYNWILLADTLWVSEGHHSLLKSCCSVLEQDGKILVCCGLHTGYTVVQRFLSLARTAEFGFKTKLIEIRRMPVWGETRSGEELRQECALLRDEDLEQYSIEDRNRTVLAYELSR
ncbi:hypothetical protein BGX21_010628 [Mortierella sp. AD011]|nr:hypothetical protein BGX20_007625 [Mortierella sp. AD010]KAF9393770.1 hypothetical protein BGX21_010625 [Mortierella sp. AD011]KAF9393771.1 hypothetical protein BGX21_010628 [Mortierella sp. AD011]